MLTLIKTRKCSIKLSMRIKQTKICDCFNSLNAVYLYVGGNAIYLWTVFILLKSTIHKIILHFFFFLISSNFMIRYGINNIFHQFRMIMQISLAPKTCSISYTGMVLIFKKGSRTNNLIYVVFKMIKVCLVQKKIPVWCPYVKSELVKMPIDSKWQKWYQNSSNIVFLYF